MVSANKTEHVDSAQAIYRAITEQLREREPEVLMAIAEATDQAPENLDFGDVALALAHFIRHEFRLQPTRFHRFVFAGGELTDEHHARRAAVERADLDLA